MLLAWLLGKIGCEPCDRLEPAELKLKWLVLEMQGSASTLTSPTLEEGSSMPWRVPNRPETPLLTFWSLDEVGCGVVACTLRGVAASSDFLCDALDFEEKPEAGEAALLKSGEMTADLGVVCCDALFSKAGL